MSKIPTSFKTQTASTQAHKPEEASHATIFSRGKSSGNQLFFALKNLFSRTDKASASSTVAKAMPRATIEPIKTPQTKKVKFAPENRKIETPMASKFTEISNKTTEKKSNQLETPTGKLPEQLDFEKFFKHNFNESLRLALDQTFDSSLFNKNVISAANTVITMQMNDDSQVLKKENIVKAIESKLIAQFNNSIESEAMEGIINAVSISFDFADAQEVRKMNELASHKTRLEEM